MKGKRRIGFLFQDQDDDSGELTPDNAGKTSKTDTIEQIISSLYTPASDIADADEFISTLDICDAVTSNCDASKSDVFTSMNKLGFRSESIEGTLYWMVRYK